MKHRDISIDITKAIGILLMMVGHYQELPFLLRNFIYSFHMPLFFILSGYFFKPQSINEVFKKGNKQLVKPYIITSVFVVFFCITMRNYTLAGKQVYAAIVSNGFWPSEILKGFLPKRSIGPIWFLLALYWCKIFYAYLKTKTEKTLLYSFLISTIALIIGKYLINLPLGILTGFCGMVFYAMGDYWKHRMRSPISRTFLMMGILVWAFCIWKSHLELASFDCKHYPISMFAAFIGTYVTYNVAKKTPRALQPAMSWLGQNTLLILCYHSVALYMVYNIKLYLLRPYHISTTTFEDWSIRLILSLLLPYIHYVIMQKAKTNIHNTQI